VSTLPALLAQRVRRDRWQLLMWIIGTALLAWSTYVGVRESFGTQHDRESLLATALANPVVMLFRGLPSGSGEGAFMLFLILPFLAMLAAFMSTFLAVRHTRAEEEGARAELVGATPAGRMAPLAATVALGLLANLALSALTATTFLAVGLPLAGCVVSGLSAGAVGVAFLGVGLVAGQVLPTSRSANALSVWTLLITFVLAGVGNAIGTPSADLQRITSAWPTWASPFGWAEQSRPFDEDALWPLVLCVGTGALLTAVAFAVQATRDLGAGLLPQRRGRPDAGPFLASPTALVWRLTRPAAAGWMLGGLITGILATSLADVLSEVTADLPSLEAIVAQLAAHGSLEQGAVVIFFTMLGLLAACCGVQIIAHARQEEVRGTAQAVLCTAVDRVGWLGGYLVVGAGGIALVITAGIGGAAAGIAAQGEPDWSLMGDVLVAGGGQAAAAAVYLAVAALAFAVVPRLAVATAWTLVIVGIVLGLFGALFGFPDWLVHLAPTANAPTVTADGIDPQGLWWLVAVTVAGSAIALTLMRSRDTAAGG